MRKVISFSLWGDSKLYCQGAIDNVEAARQYYPDWTCRFYISQECPALPVLRKMPDVELEVVSSNFETVDRTKDASEWHNQHDNRGMLWRFWAIDEAEADYVIFRDTDSRLNPREAAAVNEWIDSGQYAHRMHEVPEHWNAVIMGGMWGIRGGKLHPNLKVSQLIDKFVKLRWPLLQQPDIFIDLYFIRDVIWPKIQDKCMGHGYGHRFPFTVDWETHVGAVVNENWRTEPFVSV